MRIAGATVDAVVFGPARSFGHCEAVRYRRHLQKRGPADEHLDDSAVQRRYPDIAAGFDERMGAPGLGPDLGDNTSRVCASELDAGTPVGQSIKESLLKSEA